MLISFMIVTRKRPNQLRQALQSVAATAAGMIEVMIGVDDDDEETISARSSIDAEFPIPIRWLIAPRLDTLGKIETRLAQAATGDILFHFTDDVTLETPGWDTLLQEAFASLPGHFGVVGPEDPYHSPPFLSLPIMHRRSVELAGFTRPPWFPYWFGDTWWSEIGDFSGLKLRLPFTLGYPNGRGATQGMRDYPFWTGLFETLRPLRAETARQMIQLALPHQQALAKSLDGILKDQVLMNQLFLSDMNTPEFADTLRRAGMEESGPPSDRYLRARAEAGRILDLYNRTGRID